MDRQVIDKHVYVQIDRWIDSCMRSGPSARGQCTGHQIDRQIIRQIDGQIGYRQTCICIDKQMDRYIEYRYIDRQIDKQLDRQIDKQIEDDRYIDLPDAPVQGFSVLEGVRTGQTAQLQGAGQVKQLVATETQICKQICGQIDRQMDRQIDRQIDRQKDI